MAIHKKLGKFPLLKHHLRDDATAPDDVSRFILQMQAAFEGRVTRWKQSQQGINGFFA